MQYLLAIYGDEKAQENIPADQLDDFMAGWFKFDEELRRSVKVLAGDGLQPTSTATTVRYQDGTPVTSDGPFAETKEQLGGYYLIDVDNLDEAIKVAGTIPNLPMGGSVEVRPVQIFEQ
jgi:hypothetical protein